MPAVRRQDSRRPVMADWPEQRDPIGCRRGSRRRTPRYQPDLCQRRLAAAEYHMAAHADLHQRRPPSLPAGQRLQTLGAHTAQCGPAGARFAAGRRAYRRGSHPVQPITAFSEDNRQRAHAKLSTAYPPAAGCGVDIGYHQSGFVGGVEVERQKSPRPTSGPARAWRRRSQIVRGSGDPESRTWVAASTPSTRHPRW